MVIVDHVGRFRVPEMPPGVNAAPRAFDEEPSFQKLPLLRPAATSLGSIQIGWIFEGTGDLPAVPSPTRGDHAAAAGCARRCTARRCE